MSRPYRALHLALATVVLWGSSLAQTIGIDPRTCVEVKTIAYDDHGWRGAFGSFKLSPDGSHLAYLVKTPNLSKNTNEIALYVIDTHSPGRSAGNLVLSGADISMLSWFPDGRHLFFLMPERGKVALQSIDINTRVRQAILNLDRDILEFTLSRDGNVLAFSTPVAKGNPEAIDFPPKPLHTPNENKSGYRVPLDVARASSPLPRRSLFVSRRRVDGVWNAPVAIVIHDPFSGKEVSEFPTLALDYYIQNLSLSPDGTMLLFSFCTHDVPQEWEGHLSVKEFRLAGSDPLVTVLHNLNTRSTSIAINDVGIMSQPAWSADSTSFVLVGPAPLHTPWDQKQRNQMFRVKVAGGSVERIAAAVANDTEAPIMQYENGDVLVRTADTRLTRFHCSHGTWQGLSDIHIPLPSLYAGAPLASNGSVIFGIYEDATTPPDVFRYDAEQHNFDRLTKLNPQLEQITFGAVETIHWRTSFGTDEAGILVKPVGYAPGKRYPLVIQTKQMVGNWFRCDSGAYHMPSACPQPLASAGIMYLAHTLTPGHDETKELDSYRQRFPGQIGEVEREMDLWETAVQNLDRRGLVDASRVGLLGFSRGGWYVEFLLAHSKVRYAAATSADNVSYSLGSYWLNHSSIEGSENDLMYGGPPYGKGLTNWLDYSVSFNVDKIHTPLLMEEMGDGVHDEIPGMVPINLGEHYELFTGLMRLQKPVELYYYPNDSHDLNSPRARLASEQRNLDWYRFWLQGYERPDPEDPQQYVRWRKLRALERGDVERPAENDTVGSVPR